jgi:hypothetical protein
MMKGLKFHLEHTVGAGIHSRVDYINYKHCKLALTKQLKGKGGGHIAGTLNYHRLFGPDEYN